MTPCAISSQPPRISIQACSGTDAGSQAVPEPSCGEGNCGDSILSIDIGILFREESCANPALESAQSRAEEIKIKHKKTLATTTSSGKKETALAQHAGKAHSAEKRIEREIAG